MPFGVIKQGKVKQMLQKKKSLAARVWNARVSYLMLLPFLFFFVLFRYLEKSLYLALHDKSSYKWLRKRRLTL